MISYNTLKKILFKLDPEMAHTFMEKVFPFFTKIPFVSNSLAKTSIFSDPILEQELFGRAFYNPVGLAAGYDKNGKLLSSLPLLGFGFVEVGTVTPLAQKGNPKPRLFRHIQEESLQNAMGFNNDGMNALKKRLEKITPFTLPVGINLGKNKNSDDPLSDYKKLIKKLENFSDYIVINISSPNTPGLRDLQNEEFIKVVFTQCKELTKKPIFLKIAPDLEIDNAVNLSLLAIEYGASGIIATNTTNDYSLIPNVEEKGGLSGSVLKEKSFLFFNEIAKELFGKTTLISVGGIDSGDEAYRRIKAGASLVQVYTALVYKGPSLLYKINQDLTRNLRRDGFSSIVEAIGLDR